MLDSVIEAIGKTPLIYLKRLCASQDLGARVLAKVEAMNPGGSVKDRAAIFMIHGAMMQGALKPGGTIVESTSGNTGVGLAQAAAALGFELILTMPENMSVERRKLLKHFGARLILTPAKDGMAGSVAEARRIADTIGAFMPMQFENPDNARAHRETTAKEIFAEVERPAAALVCGVGSGGTITGLGESLKAHWPGLNVIAVEPSDSPLLSRGVAGAHNIQGIGANFIPPLLNREIFDRIIPVELPDALHFARLVAKTEGLLVGISSGAALCAAVQLAKEDGFAGKDIVVILPDTGERYLSTQLFEED